MRGKALLALALIAASPAPALLRGPLAGPHYAPMEADEQGLWMQADEYERELSTSNFVIRDPALNTYVRQIFCRTVGAEPCRHVRIYIVRTPDFNANMAPNGVMQVWSGLLLRTRDEAQLAAVLAHEYTHFEKLHSLQSFRDIKKKTGAMAWLGFVPFGFVAPLGVATSIFGFSREMESEADAGSIGLLANGGYDPMAASRVWEQLRAEQDATALARNRKSRKDKNGGIFATHPNSAERMKALKARAESQPVTAPGTLNRAEFRAGLAPFRSMFVDDQIKLNDFGGTEFLIQSLATEGWTSELLYMRGELYRTRATGDDLKAAAGFYKDALALPDAPVEAWRGLGLALLRGGDQAAGKAAGKAALRAYLARRTDAPDRAMIAMLVGEGQ